MPMRPTNNRAKNARFAHSRPAPHTAPGKPRPITDDVTWTRTLTPPEQYRILYRGSDGLTSERTIALNKTGHSGEHSYVGVTEAGQFKTFRADRILAVLEQLTTGHPPSLVAAPQYSTTLPAFPAIAQPVVKVPASAAHSTRTWTVDLRTYTCTCPEKRQRSAKGYHPGQLGHVCDHIAEAILTHLPPDTPSFTPELLEFLRDSRKVHLDNLTAV